MNRTAVVRGTMLLVLAGILAACGGASPGEVPTVAVLPSVTPAPTETALPATETPIATEVPVETPEPPTEAAPTAVVEPTQQTVGAGATAVQAFDAVLPGIQGELGEAGWISLSGNRAVGWTAGFYDAARELVLSYVIDAAGGVTRGPDAPAGLMGAATVVMERAAVAVDSDRAEQIAAEAGLDPGAAGEGVVLFLTADDHGQPWWLVVYAEGGTELTIDATTGDVRP